jgi:AcrR family transcriptional regulator
MKKNSRQIGTVPQAIPIERDAGLPAYQTRRAELLDRIVSALLDAGVAQIPLRDLARELGTSDRMLLYYFKDKSDLVQASLRQVSMRLSVVLEQLLPAKRMPPGKMLKQVIPLFSSATILPYMAVWADISARGGRGEEPFRAITGTSVAWWLNWIEARLDLAAGPRRQSVAAALLTVVEGTRLLEATTPGSTRSALELLAHGLSADLDK